MMVAKTVGLPNLRKVFVPDEGYLMVDIDLAGADAQVVAWEANDAQLKTAFRNREDVHSKNAGVLGVSRPMAKRWVHGTNYGGSPRTMGISCGITIREAEQLRERWFEAHPGIKEWHERTASALRATGTVWNRFGYRCPFFGRPDENLRAALAWIPQSTVACVTNRAWATLEEMEGTEPLLQVHDSLVFQVREDEWPDLKAQVHNEIQVVVPYDDPLVIPWDLAAGPSWGDCTEEDWS